MKKVQEKHAIIVFCWWIEYVFLFVLFLQGNTCSGSFLKWIFFSLHRVSNWTFVFLSLMTIHRVKDWAWDCVAWHLCVIQYTPHFVDYSNNPSMIASFLLILSFRALNEVFDCLFTLSEENLLFIFHALSVPNQHLKIC